MKHSGSSFKSQTELLNQLGSQIKYELMVEIRLVLSLHCVSSAVSYLQGNAAPPSPRRLTFVTINQVDHFIVSLLETLHSSTAAPPQLSPRHGGASGEVTPWK